MERIELVCQNEACEGEGFSYRDQEACPFCKADLVPDLGRLGDSVYRAAILDYPSCVSNPVFRMLVTTSMYRRMHYLSDAFLSTLRLVAGILVSEYRRKPEGDDTLDERIQNVGRKESHGALVELIERLCAHLRAEEGEGLASDATTILGKEGKGSGGRRKFQVESHYTDESGMLHTIRSEGTPIQHLVNFRNRHLGHGTVVGEEESAAILDVYEPIFQTFLNQSAFLSGLGWTGQDGNRYTGLFRGTDPSRLLFTHPTAGILTIEKHWQTGSLESGKGGGFACRQPGCRLGSRGLMLRFPQPCPSCGSPLMLDEARMIDDVDERICRTYPYILAMPFRRALVEHDPYKRLHLLKETFLNLLKYIGLMVASEYFSSGLRLRRFNDIFRELVFRPQFGYWNRFIREGMLMLNDARHTWFIRELPEYYARVETDVYEASDGGSTAIGRLIEFRNRHLGHGLVPSDRDCERLWDEYHPILRSLLSDMGFCTSYTMVAQDNLQQWRLMGTDPIPIPSKNTSDAGNRVRIVNPAGEGMGLVPFFVLPGEYFRKDTSSRSRLMVYEQNTGKRIVFFSPESVSDESSGSVLTRLNLLLADKDRDEPLTAESLSRQGIRDCLIRHNTDTVRVLAREKKVVEGVYQPREEIEVMLRSWTGSSAGIFFLAAESGSGKTNLLVEMSRQYTEMGIDNLLLRAGRMTQASLWTEMCAVWNIHPGSKYKDYDALRTFERDTPLIVLIDGGNEHPKPDELFSGILRLLDENKGGGLKIVLSWRVNVADDIPRVDKLDLPLFHSDDMQQGGKGNALAPVHWLKPLNMKELEGAWKSYAVKSPKTHKPPFSFEDLCVYDRSLAERLKNPLMLRLFLELFHGRPLPRRMGEIDIWGMYYRNLTSI